MDGASRAGLLGRKKEMILTKRKTGILVMMLAVAGLSMSIYSTAYGQSIDAGDLIARPAKVENAQVDAGISNAPAKVDKEELVATQVKTEVAHVEAEAAPVEASTDVQPVATAAKENPAKEDTVGAAKGIYNALRDGKWLVAFGGFLMFFVWGIRAFFSYMDFKWARGELAGNLIAFSSAFALSIGIAVSAGEGLSLGLLMATAGATWLAKGNWSHVQAQKAKKKE